MLDNITIGIKVIKNSFSEQIDVYFVKDSTENDGESFYNLENDYLDKRDIVIRRRNKQILFDVVIDYDQNIVDSKDDIRLEFDKAYNDKKIRINTLDEDEDEDELEKKQIQPYDPNLIRVDPKQFTIESTVNKIKKSEIDLNPDFQRKFVWTDITRKSRLIESILLRIPLPVFYLSQDEDGIYHVLDGLQRLTVLSSYLSNEFRLKNLEYLNDECGGLFFGDVDGKLYEQKPDRYLPTKYVRRIKDTMLNFNVVDSGTPEQAKYDIFRRINTGGKPLNRQEMRNAMANVETRKLLSDLADLLIFKVATGYSVKDTRFADQELILRFIGFYLIDKDYQKAVVYKGVMATFLDQVIEVLNKYYSSKNEFRNEIFRDFQNSMSNSYLLFGDRGFKRTTIINKALFLSVSRNAYNYEVDIDCDVEKTISLRDNFFKEEESQFWSAHIDSAKLKSRIIDESLSKGTNEIQKINDSYNIMSELMEVLVNEQNFKYRN
ncbi:DUF262 domain-containing protein [Carnobacterium divergens]|uniref:DUF262 domain-containing protein n=1 Tax=Carnobacterium divergens TaxID=2748 RepID=UPI00143073AB|nr:DUF262 domain-containing protein [Carnobacterium divergens]MDT1997105.1 DUF262 domain-containing protein [Carnobacterium divergens]